MQYNQQEMMVVDIHEFFMVRHHPDGQDDLISVIIPLQAQRY